MRTRLRSKHVSKYFLPILLFGALLGPLSSMSQETPPFVGNWTLDYTTTLSTAQTQNSAVFATLSAEVLSQIQLFYQGRQFNFLNDGTFTLVSTDLTSISGTWSYLAASGQLTLTEGSSGQQAIYTATVSGASLVLTVAGTNASTAIIQNLYLTPTL